MRRTRWRVWIILLVFLLSGCWDQREVEERSVVLAIGIDKAEDDPELLELSYQIPIPLKIAGAKSGVSGGGSPVHVVSGKGRTIYEAFNDMQRKLNQQVFFGHTRTVIFSEELAREGIGEILDVFRRAPQIRRLLWPIVVKGRALDALHVLPDLEQIPTVYLMNLIENGIRLGTIPDMSLGGAFVRVRNPSEELFLNYFMAHEKKMEWQGIAVFKGDRMIGKLNDEQAWSFMQMALGKNGIHLIVPYEADPERLLSVHLETNAVHYTFTEKNGAVQAEIRVVAEVDLNNRAFALHVSTPDVIEKLERSVKHYLEQRAKETVKMLQEDYQSDVLGLGNYIRAYHPEIWSQIKNTDYFPNLQIQVNYTVKLRRTGMQKG